MKYVMLLVVLVQSACGAISFTNEIAPILVQKCLACHNEKKAKGRFQLHTFGALMGLAKKSAPAIVPGKPDDSSLYQLLITANADDRMPQEDDPLPKEQIARIRQWIAEGAKYDGHDRTAMLSEWAAADVEGEPPGEYPFAVPVTALAFSDNGTELLSSGYHEVLVWDAEAGVLRRRIKGLPQKIQDLAFSPNGEWLVAAGGTPGKQGQVVAIASNRVEVLATATDMLMAVCFDAGGNALAVGGSDNAICIFDWATRKKIKRIEQHADWVLDVAFHPDGKHIVSASRDKTARLIEIGRGELESTYQGHTEGVFAVVANAKGDRLYSAGRDRKIHVWEPKEAKKVGEVAGFGGDIYRLLGAKDRLFVAGANGAVSEYRMNEKRELVRTYAGHSGAVFALATSADGKRLATGSHDGEVRIWDAESGKSLRAFIAAPGHKRITVR